MRVDYAIVGAGYCGCVIAERIASQLDKNVLLVDRRNHVGGNSYDCYDEHGILIHRYGSHIFHTNNREVWEYLSRFTEWRPYSHEVLAMVDGRAVPVPFNLNSLHALFSPKQAENLEGLLVKEFGFGAKVPILKLRETASADLRFLSEYVYAKVFESYTRKQWGLGPEELDPSVTERVPVYVSRDNRYFQDIYQGVPLHGYTPMFQRMIDHPRIKVLLNAGFQDVADELRFDTLIYTGAIDEYFDYMHGLLPYRSLEFDYQTHECEHYLPAATVNYPNEYDFTRIAEHKYMTGQKHDKTTVLVEYPRAHRPGENEPHYPIPRQDNHEQYDGYLAEAKKLKGTVVFAGRLADYKYYNMDQAVARALDVFATEVVGKERAQC